MPKNQVHTQTTPPALVVGSVFTIISVIAITAYILITRNAILQKSGPSSLTITPTVAKQELSSARPVAGSQPTPVPGCYCNDPALCYPDGCTRRPLNPDGSIKPDCGGDTNMKYDPGSTDANRYFCLEQPPCCDLLAKSNNKDACCIWEIGYCNPYYCDQLTGDKGVCGWYWKWHGNVPEWFQREYGYGCLKGPDEQNLTYSFGSAPYPLLSLTAGPPTRPPSPTSQPQSPTATKTPVPSRTLTPTVSFTPTLTSTLSPTMIPSTTPKPTSTSTPTPSPILAPFCDSRCGVCGWRDMTGSCHPDGPVIMPGNSQANPTTGVVEGATGVSNQYCCYHACVKNQCVAIAGYGGEGCTSSSQCVPPTAVPTIQTRELPGTGITSAPPVVRPTNPPVAKKPPVSGDPRWMYLLLVPIAVIVGGVVL